MFKPVDSRANFPAMEEGVLGLWREKDIFKKSLDNRRDCPRFNLYEGPPTANGSPGIHHVLSRVFKDVIPRYKTMKGYYVPRIAGWDTHGLPVELEVEKELGFKSKADIEKYGIDKFNARCRQSVFRYLEQWNALTERIGFWLDLEHPYITMKNTYIESCWWAIKQMWEKGLVYQGYRVTPHCPRCGTSLSSHEVALGYKDDTEDPSVYIKFRLTEESRAKLNLDKPAYMLAWTTTPWTLPSNTALAIAAGAEYVVVEVDGEYLVLAAARTGQVGLGDAPVFRRIDGDDVAGLRYLPLFSPAEFGLSVIGMEEIGGGEAASGKGKSGTELTYPVIAGDFVSMEDGTGVVHVAPAYGEIDFETGLANRLDFVHSVDLQGRVIGTYPWAGKFVKQADKDIIADLKERGLMFKAETIRHTYPFCWRCGTPLLYYAKETWYIRTTAVKDRLVAGNKEINWYPEHIKYGRFGDWLENNVDWAFSRERYWGTPLPVWRCQSCGRCECIGGLDELKQKPAMSGLHEPLDLHRPYIDEVTFDCAACSGRMKRVAEVIDCWFDSGNMPIAQWHYPFEHGEDFQKSFPADFICEAVDQTRGWFYSLHAISTLLFDKPCYKNVICLGHILDARGEKMSKTKKNVVEPMPVINKYGADAVRWYLFTASPPGNARRFSEQLVSEVTRQFLLTLWNVYSFFVTYANIDNYRPGKKTGSGEPAELDRWIISELNRLIAEVDEALEKYNPTEAARKMEVFVDSLSNWYVRRSRRRFWKSENDTDKLSAYDTLYHCLVTLSKLLAPFMPFVSEELYQNLVVTVSPDAPESVHLADFPAADRSKIDEKLSADTHLVMKVSSLGRAARSKAGIKVRQPLANVCVGVSTGREKDALERLKPQVLEELNVKEMEVRSLEQVEGLEGAGYLVCGAEPGEEAEKAPGLLVAVSTGISDELLDEGMAREIVHRLQTMRRSAGFDIIDRINTFYEGDENIERVMGSWGEYIKKETLSEKLAKGVPAEGVYTESFKIDGKNIKLAVAKLSC